MTNLNIPGLDAVADVANYMRTVGAAARKAARALARADTYDKNSALHAMGGALRRDEGPLLAANRQDIGAAKKRALRRHSSTG